ncbi:hypothetical protein N7453_002803 [Penicillium expansum]|nr:hypothetical protein N7453_002803 [Penicillium expansum]
MAPKRPCPACGQISHPLRECPFRGFHDESQDKPSITTVTITRTLPGSFAHLGLRGRAKRQVAHPLRSLELRKPKPSPLALYCETSVPTDNAVEATPITESMPSEDAVETTPANEPTISANGTERNEST